MKYSPAFVRRCHGQAIAEYMVVLAVVAVGLAIADADPAVVDQLVAAVKSFFKAFSFALSIPAQHGV